MLSGLFSGFMVGTWLEASVMALVAGAVGFFVVLRGVELCGARHPPGCVHRCGRRRTHRDQYPARRRNFLPSRRGSDRKMGPPGPT